MMDTTDKPLASIDDLMDAEFGKIGTRQREAFRKEAYDYCMKSRTEKGNQRKSETEFSNKTKPYV